MRILIIGGTGFIGPDIIKLLDEKGYEIILFNDGRIKFDLSNNTNHIHILGDIRCFNDFKDVFKRLSPDLALWDMFFFSEKDAQNIMTTLKGITQRIVVISGMDVYRAYGKFLGIEDGPIEPVPITEDSPLRQILFPYYTDFDKLLVEQAFMNDPDMPGTILRLPGMYGPRAQMFRLFYLLKRMDDKRPAILLSGDWAIWSFSQGYVENIAAAIVLAVSDERASGRIYNLGEIEPTTMSEWIRKIGDVAGWEGEIITVPNDRQPPILPHLMMNVNVNQHLLIDSTRIRRELEYNEHISLDEALVRTINWERSNPPSHIDPIFIDYAMEDAILIEMGLKGHTYH